MYNRNSKSDMINHSLGKWDGGSISSSKVLSFRKNIVSLWDIKSASTAGTADYKHEISKVMSRNSLASVALVDDRGFGYVSVLDLNTLEPSISFCNGHERSISCMYFHDKEQIVWTGCKDGNLKIWDVRAGCNFLENYWHKKVGVVAVHVFNNKMVTSTTNNKVWFWDCRSTRAPICKYSVHVKVNHLHIAHDQNFVFGASVKGLFASWKF